MEIKLFDSELKVMDILWKEGDTSAKDIAEILNRQVGWSKTTTYTVIKKCVEKGAVTRREPGFVCTAAISRKEVQNSEAQELIDRLFGGAPDLLVSALVSSGKINAQQVKAPVWRSFFCRFVPKFPLEHRFEHCLAVLRQLEHRTAT